MIPPLSRKPWNLNIHLNAWLDAMKGEKKSTSTNDVWDLVEISDGAKIVGY
jgi:hypothetical protein